ncbi:MAG: helix-turn-helix domain-containing protein [Mycobacteriales bacterium]
MGSRMLPGVRLVPRGEGEDVMTAGHGPLIGGRRLRAELRRLRESARLTQDQVADEMDWSLSKLIRIEAGAVGISQNDLKALLHLYHVADDARVEDMLTLARAARQKMWWDGYRDIINKQFSAFVGFESEASVIKTFQLLIVPGLLQTEDYARTVIRHMAFSTVTEKEIDRHVQLRMERKERLLQGETAPRLFVVIDESILRRAVGGADVLSRQLDFLVEAASLPSVVLQVLPHSTGIFPGMAVSFTLMEFSEEDEEPALFVEGPNARITDDPAERRPANYQAAFNTLSQRSLGQSESIALIKKIAKEIS